MLQIWYTLAHIAYIYCIFLIFISLILLNTVYCIFLHISWHFFCICLLALIAFYAFVSD